MPGTLVEGEKHTEGSPQWLTFRSQRSGGFVAAAAVALLPLSSSTTHPKTPYITLCNTPYKCATFLGNLSMVYDINCVSRAGVP